MCEVTKGSPLRYVFRGLTEIAERRAHSGGSHLPAVALTSTRRLHGGVDHDVRIGGQILTRSHPHDRRDSQTHPPDLSARGGGGGGGSGSVSDIFNADLARVCGQVGIVDDGVGVDDEAHGVLIFGN